MSTGQLATFCVLLLLCGSIPAAQSNWVPLGQSSLGKWQIYIESNSVHTDANGYVSVLVLDDYRVTQTGVDFVDSSGHMFRDEEHRYRSSVTRYLLDCAKRRERMLQMRYYAGDMGTGALVLLENETDPIWTDLLFDLEKNLVRFACSRKNPQ